MSAEPNNAFLPNSDSTLNAALIERYSLSELVVARINDAERRLGVCFSDAAVFLGIMKQEDVDAIRAVGNRLVVVHRERVKPDDSLVLVRDPFDPHSERVRSLRTELLLRRDASGGADVIVVMSPCAGEGRSQLAAELAIAFAQLGQPTLLVDADLRHPRQHLLFGADNKQGLSDAIALDATPYLHPVEGLPQLSLLTAGPAPQNPLELLCDSRFEKMIDDWRRSFAYVVFDTAPVERYSDALAVATLVGRVLAVCRAQHTPYADTRNMLRRLAATQSRILGAVVNHF